MARATSAGLCEGGGYAEDTSSDVLLGPRRRDGRAAGVLPVASNPWDPGAAMGFARASRWRPWHRTARFLGEIIISLPNVFKLIVRL